MPDKNWQFELEEYIKQGEPDRAEKSKAWQTAIGLQAVDGLNTSAYLLDTAKDHIEGKITIDEAQQRIHNYYEQRTTRTEIENETKEADIVSARIAKLLGEKAFQFSPAEWLSIHRRLFEGVFRHAGQVRQYNITKKEWVLNGDTVTYADWNSIKDTLDYDFATEKQFSYEGLSVDAAVKHLAKFASDIWQMVSGKRFSVTQLYLFEKGDIPHHAINKKELAEMVETYDEIASRLSRSASNMWDTFCRFVRQCRSIIGE